MKQTRSLVIALAIALLSLVGLAACGGENPTATPLAATATPVLPTATAVPPTATTAPQVSNPASSAEIEVLRQAMANTSDLKTYHFNIEVKQSEFITQPVKAEGDFVAPNTAYYKGTVGNNSFEQIVVGDTVFVKDKSGTYVVKPEAPASNDILSGFTTDSITASSNPIGGMGSTFEQVKNFTNAGTTNVNGVTVTKYAFKLDIADMLGGQAPEGLDLTGLNDLGQGEVWIDTKAKDVYRLDFTINLGTFTDLLSQAFAGFAGTPTPGGAKPTPLPKLPVNVIMNVSRHNDPSISIPLTDEMKKLAEPTPEVSPTDEPIAEETPDGSATPEGVDTPESVETPEGAATPEELGTPEAIPTFPQIGGEAEVVNGNIGQALTLGDTTLTVNKVERSTSGNLAPASGNEFIILTVTIENKSKEDLTISGLLSFALKDAAGTDQSFSFGAKYNNMLDSATDGPIKAGAKVTGELGYEVKKGNKDLTLRFVPNFLNDKAYISVKIDQ